MLLTVFFVAYFVLLAAILWLKFRSRDLFEMLPSLFWASTMVLPYWVQQQTLVSWGEGFQIYGVLGIGYALLLADGWEARRVRLVEDVPSPGLTLLSQCLMIFFGGLQVIHLGLLEDNIRLLFWIRGEQAGYFFEQDHLLWFKALLMLGTPITLALLLRSRRMGLTAFFYIFSVFYGLNISVEMGVIFMVLGVLLYGLELVRFFSRRVWVVLGFLALMPLTIWWYVLEKDHLSSLSTTVPPKKISELKAQGIYKDNGFQALTQGDHFRLLKSTERYDNELSLSSKFYNDVLYDFFIGPVESSSWWYDYFSRIEEDGAKGGDLVSLLLERRELLGPANRVGIWALSRRFPEQFSESSFVYASVDARAFARWGVWGLTLSILLIFLLRLWIKKLKVRSPWGDSLNLIVLFLLAVGLPHASGWAVLGRYGVGIGVFLMFCHYMLCRNYLKEDYLPASRSFDLSR